MNPHVFVRIQLGPWPDDSDKSVVVPLAEYVVREAQERLDYATPDAPVAVKMFITTPPRQIRETQVMRRELADVVAAAVKAKVLEMLGEHDTVMGYKREADSASGVHRD